MSLLIRGGIIEAELFIGTLVTELIFYWPVKKYINQSKSMKLTGTRDINHGAWNSQKHLTMRQL
jgi:hypothetical protein